jgi:light-regulated signal transduction histidine kinase (bacteriophytochrome)
MNTKVAIHRLSTGVPGLDEVLGGGLPEFSFNLIAGPPGCGKTTLAHQMIFALANPQRRALYFTVLGEPPLKMLRYQQQQDDVVIHVGDNGIGISPGALARVFEPFAQDAHATGFNGQGLGIGLTVVKELVEAHGGTVVVASGGIGLGSEFTVTFPLHVFREEDSAG